MQCPTCCGKTHLVYKDKNVFFTDGKCKLDKFKLSCCSNCGFVFQSSAYSKKYDKITSELYSNYNNYTFFDFPRKDFKTLDSLNFLTNNLAINHNWNILEIGSGDGDFLFILRERCSCNVVGIEPSATKHKEIPTINLEFSVKLFANKFDLIILKHTFEHIKYPKKFIQDLSTVLKDNGYIFIEVPSLDISIKHYLGDFIPDHVSYFSVNSLNFVCNKYKLLYAENNHFLRAIYQNTNNSTCEQYDNINDVSIFFKEFDKQKSRFHSFILEKSKSHSIIFYGIGLYFRTLFAELEDLIFKQNCFFIDDGYIDEIEPIFGLKKFDLNMSKSDIVVVGCTNDFNIQNAMKDKIETKIKKLTFIHLYSNIEILGV